MAAIPEGLPSALSGRYRIEREIGRGGMATVYLAHDIRHGRKVAFKVLHPELGVTLGAERFLEEIRTTANLQHPAILPLFDSGADGGFLYYVMPYVDGESLRERIERRGPLDVDETVEIAKAVADALDHAHRQGVIHRDIKPGNILLQGAHAQVADFGVALAVHESGGRRITEPGLAVGSPAYMSPEQVTGEALDGRSDLFSLGCVLFEMLTGEPPFTGANAQVVMVKRFAGDVPAVSRSRPSTPPWLSRIVARLLERAADNRFESAASLLEALRAGEGSVPVPALGERSVAVLPFVNISPDRQNEHFCDGMTEDVLTRLASIAELKVPSRTSCMRYKGVGLPLRTIADELGVASVLEGSVRRDGNRLRVVTQLIDARTDEHVWAEQYERDMTDVFAVQAEIAERIANAMHAHLSPGERARLEARPTRDLEAYNLYLLGRYHYARVTGSSFRHSMEYFGRATERDASFAAAWAALAEACFYQGTGYFNERPRDIAPLFRHASTRAIELDPELAEAHAWRGAYLAWFDFDWVGAHASLDRALELDPTCGLGRHARATVLALEARPREAYREMAKAIEADPVSVLWHANAAAFLYMDRQYEAAIEHFDRLATLDPASPWKTMVGLPLAQLDRREDALDAFAEGVELSGGASFFRLLHAYGLAGVGRVDECHTELEELRALESDEFVWPVGFAYALALLGDTDGALDRLRQGLDERAGWIWIPNEPVFDAVRSDSRFARIMGTALLRTAEMSATDPHRDHSEQPSTS